MADIDLLFGVAGGGDVAGESGSLIKSQLESIIKGIEPLKVKVGIDVEASKKDFAADVESLFKGASKTIKLKLDAHDIGKSLSDGAIDKSIKKSALTFEKAEEIAKNYYATLRQVNEANKSGMVLDLQSDGTVKALSKEFEELAERSNQAQREMNALKKAVYSLPDTQKKKIQNMLKVEDGDYRSNMFPTPTATENSIKGVTAELKEQIYTYKEAESAIKKYNEIISAVTKNNADIEWDVIYGKYVSKSGVFNQHAESLNETEEAYNRVIDAMHLMPLEDQIRLQKLMNQEVEKYNITLEGVAGRERYAFDYNDSVRAVKDYYKTLSTLERNQDAKKHISQKDNGYWSKDELGNDMWVSKYEYISDTSDYEELASALNRTKTAFDAVVEARSNLLSDKQAKLQTLMTQEVQKYNLLIEDQANKIRLASQAKQQKEDTRVSLKSETEAYKGAEKAITDFYKAQRDAASQNADIDLGEDGKYYSLSGEFSELANRLNRTQEAFNGVEGAMKSMSPENQARLTQLLTSETNELNEAIENQVRQEQASAKASAEAARVAADAAQQKVIAQNKLKAEAEQYEYLEKAIKDYYKAQNDLLTDKSGVGLNEDTGKYSLESGVSSAFTDRLNKTALAYQGIESAIKSLPIEQQVKLNALIDDYAQKLREASQAKHQKEDTQAALKAEADAYEKATNDLKEYYKARTDAVKFGDEIYKVGDQWETQNANLKSLVERLNETQKAFVQAETTANSFSDANKKLFEESKTKEARALSEAIEAYNRSMEGAEVKEYQRQLDKVNDLLVQIKKNLKDWSSAKNGSSSSSYKGLEETADVLEDMRSNLLSTGKALDDFDNRFDKASSNAKNFSTNIKLAGENAKSINKQIGDLLNTLGISITYVDVFRKVIEIGREMVEVVTEVDSAMTELKKVTEETNATYTRFLENAKDRAHNLGATVAETVNATADFARLGHSITDASSLADAAIVYKNVGDGIEDISVASESIISTMQAFGIEAKDAMAIIDSFNNVGNNFAISSKGIGDALLNSAASLHAAGNDIHESIALIAAANTTIQDPGKVGKCLPNNAVMHCKKIAISVKGWRQLRPRKDFVVCVRRVRESTDFYYL